MTGALHELGARELQRGYASGAFSPVDVAQAVLARIDRWEPQLHATWLLRPELALTQARESEARWQRGAPLSPLDGVPMTLKDNLATQGDPTPLGTAAAPLFPAPADAPPAARLREAGAVLVSKTTMPDYGMLSSGLSSFHALARNPWDLSKGPGGSSAGAGAAAAAGYGPLHVGTDIGGSLRLPASWCGIFTLKPSLGRIPIDPPYTGRAAGPMTRSVEDAALMMAVLSQPDARDSMALPPQDIAWRDFERGPEHLRGLRIGLLLDAGCGLPVDPQVRAAIAQAAQLFESAGASVTPMQPFLAPEMLAGMDRFWRMRSHLDMAALPPERKARVLPFIQAWADSAAGFSGTEGVPRRPAVPRHTRRHRGGLQRVRLCALARRADHRLCRRAGQPDQRPAARARAHSVYRALQHVGAAGRVHQLRLQRRRPAHRPTDAGGGGGK